MNLEDKNITELKAMVYDFQVTIQQTQKNIEIVNNLIAKKYEEQNNVKKDDTSES